MKKRRVLTVALTVFLTFTFLFVLGAGISFLYVRNNIDFTVDEGLFIKNQTGTLTRLYYNEGEHGGYLPRELCSITPREAKRVWCSYGEIGENVKNAFIAAEDRDFFTHKGVNVKRSLWAIANYFLKIKPTFGASTITQQVIKNISGDNQQTARRKAEEIIRALKIETHHSKEEILELYLNIVPMGEGISGVGLASEYYFGKTPDELSLSEAATLAGITNAPSRYNPHTKPTECLKKRNVVLYAMLDFGVISEEEYESATKEPLGILEKHELCEGVESWYTELVISDVVKDLARERGMTENAARLLVYNGGLTVYTAVNPRLQAILEGYFENLENLPKKVEEGLDFGMVVIDSKTGYIVATVGGAGKKTQNRITDNTLTPHPPASALKPIALYAPLINKNRINWATVFDDVPVSFSGSGEDYIEYPRNYPNAYDGLITVSDALRVSKNTVAVRLSKLLGEEKIYSNLVKDFEFDTLIAEKTVNGRKITDISTSPLALGQLSYGISLRKLTEAYTVFANEGELLKSKSYLCVLDGGKEVLLDNAGGGKRVFSVPCARIINQLLMRVTDSGTAKSITLKELVDTAGKTGTSSGDRDRIFVGYTPYYTAGIWCGYPRENKEITALDKTHLQIWDEVMHEIHRVELENSEEIESFSVEGLLYLPYCRTSGMLHTSTCELDPRGDTLDYGYFYTYNRPRGNCTRHVLCDYDELTGGVATDGCDSEFISKIALLDIKDRSFPKQIYITDAQYVYRRVEKGVPYGDGYDVPYFINMLADGEYCGISKGKKQFNSACYIHDG